MNEIRQVTVIYRGDGSFMVRSPVYNRTDKLVDARGRPLTSSAVKAAAVRIWAEAQGRNRLKLVK